MPTSRRNLTLAALALCASQLTACCAWFCNPHPETAKTCYLWGHVWNHDGIPSESKLYVTVGKHWKHVDIDPTTGFYAWLDAPVGPGTARLGSETQGFECFPDSGTAVNFRFDDASVPSPPPPKTATCHLWGYVLDTDNSSPPQQCPPNTNNGVDPATLWTDLEKSGDLVPITHTTEPKGFYSCTNCKPGPGKVKLNNAGPAQDVICFGTWTQVDLQFQSGHTKCASPTCNLWGYVLEAGHVPDPADYLKFTTYGSNISINDSTGFYQCANCVQGNNPVKLNNTGTQLTPSCPDSSGQRNLSFP